MKVGKLQRDGDLRVSFMIIRNWFQVGNTIFKYYLTVVMKCKINCSCIDHIR